MGAAIRTRLASACLSSLICLTIPTAEAVAQAVLPPRLAEQLTAAAQASRDLADRDREIGRGLANAALADSISRKSRHRQQVGLSSIVIAAIARRPDLIEPIIAAVSAAAPASRDSVIDAASRAYPAFAGRIAAAAGEPAARRARPAPSRARPAAPSAAANERAVRALPEQIRDPLEGLNRVIFAFNDTLDVFVLRPLAVVYGFVTPAVVKASIARAFDNLNAPVVFANDLLRLEIVDAGQTAGRFAVNSTVGLAGLLDVAQAIGLEHHDADFGHTLFSYGVGPGVYLVMPVIGPSTLRDGAGKGVDLALDPFSYIFDTGINLAFGAAEGVVRREAVLEPLEDLRRTSVDYYAAVRAAYYQGRAATFGGGTAPQSSQVDQLFDNAQ